jgi:hypothetical protein
MNKKISIAVNPKQDNFLRYMAKQLDRSVSDYIKKRINERLDV